jgi:hypothetical protein
MSTCQLGAKQSTAKRAPHFSRPLTAAPASVQGVDGGVASGSCEVRYEDNEVVLRSRGDVVARIHSGAVEVAPDPTIRPHWRIHFTIDDVEAAARAARPWWHGPPVGRRLDRGHPDWPGRGPLLRDRAKGALRVVELSRPWSRRRPACRVTCPRGQHAGFPGKLSAQPCKGGGAARDVRAGIIAPGSSSIAGRLRYWCPSKASAIQRGPHPVALLVSCPHKVDHRDS